ncbi:hypothetical protein Pfo_024603 [Paulownia fortunei]|nr:hypothetical protein Pfo_024603 [Paulownia fortunei]
MSFVISSHSGSLHANFMSFLHMGFPQKEDAIDRKSINSETTEMSDRGGVIFGEESVFEFWPIQHPIEPPQWDKPVECPLPHSSLINEGRLSGSFYRKVAEPTSKRHHSLGHGNHYRTASLRRPPVSPQATMLQRLQQFNKFEA